MFFDGLLGLLQGAQDMRNGSQIINFLHSPHNFGVYLLVLIFGCAQFFGFIGSKVGTHKYANQI